MKMLEAQNQHRDTGTAGGMADEAYAFYKRLASLLSDKWNKDYAAMMGWIRCWLLFILSLALRYTVLERFSVICWLCLAVLCWRLLWSLSR